MALHIHFASFGNRPILAPPNKILDDNQHIPQIGLNIILHKANIFRYNKYKIA